MTEATSQPGHPHRRPAGKIDDWTAQLGQELGVDTSALDISQLLDVARDVAHAVDRPAVPVTMFLLGFAAARQGGSVEVVDAECDLATRLAQAWAARESASES